VLTILEASDNIEKYQKEPKAWRDKKTVRKNIKTRDLVLKRKKNSENREKLQESWEGPHSKRNKHVRGFPLDRPNRRRAAAFMECRQLK
jgi:hypothetical protein